jgi:lipid-binding SYLF domain-containing protein
MRSREASTVLSFKSKSNLNCRKGQNNEKRMIVFALCLTVASPLFAQKKEQDRIANSAEVLRQLLAGDNSLSTHILDQADCVVIFPSVKKIAIGIGGSYGRGVLVCRKGPKMDGPWGTPAMYRLDQASIGVQLGSTATDFVLTVIQRLIAKDLGIKGRVSGPLRRTHGRLNNS